MLKKVTTKKNTSYGKTVMYSGSDSYKERLKKVHAVDLRNNVIIKHLPDGYCKVTPVNKKKYI